MIHLTVQSRAAPEGTFVGVPKHALSNLHKDTQGGTCEVALKGAHLRFHLSCTCGFTC